MGTAVVRKEDGTVVCADCVVADSAWARSKGLLGRASLGEDEGILLRPGSSIHMFFMRFPIDAVFLDRELARAPRGGRPQAVAGCIEARREGRARATRGALRPRWPGRRRPPRPRLLGPATNPPRTAMTRGQTPVRSRSGAQTGVEQGFAYRPRLFRPWRWYASQRCPTAYASNYSAEWVTPP